MDRAFDDILAANRAFAGHFTLGSLPAPAARGLAVLTCIDSRILPLAMLGLEPGDAKIIRNAGARATDDAIRSLVLAANLLNVRRIMVIAHTDCAMADISDSSLRQTLIQHNPSADFSQFDPLAMTDQPATLATDVERLRQCPLFPSGTDIAGFQYDVTSGLLRQFNRS